MTTPTIHHRRCLIYYSHVCADRSNTSKEQLKKKVILYSYFLSIAHSARYLSDHYAWQTRFFNVPSVKHWYTGAFFLGRTSTYLLLAIMSPWNGKTYCFSSVGLSVRPPVCPFRFCVRSIYFEPLVGFTNNFAQMSSLMRRCAVSIFDQGRFKVKVTI